MQYLKILLDIVLDANTFDNQVKAYLKARFQGRSRRLLREPLPSAKKRKAPDRLCMQFCVQSNLHTSIHQRGSAALMHSLQMRAYVL